METQKYKVVCIVDNYTNGKKLDAAFNNADISAMSLNEEYFNGISNATPFLLITKQGKPLLQESLNANDTWDILLIHDENKQENRAKDLEFLNSFTTDTLVVWHENAKDFLPENTLQEKMKNREIKKYKIGMHSSGDDYGYARLMHFIKAWDGKQFIPSDYDKAKKEIVEWFGINDKLNAALEFLHKSLGDTPAKTNILTRNGLFDLGKTVNGKTLQSWLDQLKSNTSEAYKKALRDVRDVLLKDAGETGEN